MAFGWLWEFGVREGFREKKHFFWNLKGLTGGFLKRPSRLGGQPGRRLEVGKGRVGKGRGSVLEQG